MIPLYKPFMPDVPKVHDILHSGRLAYGNYARAFEIDLKAYFGTEQLIVTNTFNMAILVSLSTLGVRSGYRALASPMACLASTQPLLSLGVEVVWADVDPNTGSLCPDSARSIIKTEKIDVILHNQFCGYPGHLNEIFQIGKEFGIPVVNDCIEAFGSEYRGVKVGTIGSDLTFFSFNPVRIPNTLDGGAIIFKSTELFEKSILVRDAGIDRKCFRDDQGEISPSCDITLIGHSATPMELNGYIGSQQMLEVSKLLGIQRANAKAWDKKIEKMSGLRPISKGDGQPNYWVYGLLSNNKRETMRKFRDLGFYASGVHINNNRYSVFKSRRVLSGVDEFMNSFVALPCGWWLDEKDVQSIRF